MTQRFILDENVVILAQVQETAQGETDLTCLNLLNQIIDICHTMVVDYNLWGKYQTHLHRLRLEDPQSSPLLFRLFNNAIQIHNKVEFRNNAAEFPEENNIPQGSQDDVPIVRVAVETGATLVTTDNALMEDLNSCGVQETYNLVLLSPEEALRGL